MLTAGPGGPQPERPQPTPDVPLVPPVQAQPKPDKRPATGRDLGLRLARALKLDPDRITAMTLRINTDLTELATLEVESYVPGDPIETVLTQYDLVERKPDAG